MSEILIPAINQPLLWKRQREVFTGTTPKPRARASARACLRVRARVHTAHWYSLVGARVCVCIF